MEKILLLKINPGYMGKDFLIAYEKYLEDNSDILDNKGLVIKSLVKNEMIIRGYSGSNEALYIDLELSDEDLLFWDIKKRRISIPKNVQTIWAQHKYSVLARDNKLYREIGKSLVGKKGISGYEELFNELKNLILTKPDKGSLFNGVLHIWGYLPSAIKKNYDKPSIENMKNTITTISDFAVKGGSKYLLQSTALSDFLYWAKYYEKNDT
jgi:uncharacterized protein YbgA (DUF1722 family)